MNTIMAKKCLVTTLNINLHSYFTNGKDKLKLVTFHIPASLEVLSFRVEAGLCFHLYTFLPPASQDQLIEIISI